MQIVIDIDDDMYKSIVNNDAYVLGDADWILLENAIANGTPLPKGHGRLIAEPTEEKIAKTIGGKNDFADCIREAVKTVFENAPTIIEADKEHKE